MRQSDDPKAFFEKFRFTQTITQPSAEFKGETLHFEGLEARYVSSLEHTNNDLLRHIKELRDRIWWLQEKEYRKPLGELLADQGRAEEKT